MTEKRKSDFFESSNKRRSSFFDTKLEGYQFPTVLTFIKYPSNYIERVTHEIEEWRKQVIKASEERLKFKQDKKELKAKLLDETTMSTEQLDFLGSIDFNNYMRIAEDFCIKMVVQNRLISDDNDYINELEELSTDLQKKLESEVFGAMS